MTEAALEGERCIGMVTVRPEAIGDIGGNPPVFPIGCAGVIEQIAKRPNGRFDAGCFVKAGENKRGFDNTGDFA